LPTCARVWSGAKQSASADRALASRGTPDRTELDGIRQTFPSWGALKKKKAAAENKLNPAAREEERNYTASKSAVMRHPRIVALAVK